MRRESADEALAHLGELEGKLRFNPAKNIMNMGKSAKPAVSASAKDQRLRRLRRAMPRSRTHS